MKKNRHRLYPVEKADFLQGGLRRLYQNPHKLLSRYLEEGMVVLDFGCGPGFFTIEAARMVGDRGKIIAADLQQGMLDKLNNAIQSNEIKKRIVLHKSNEDTIGITEKVDIVLAFHVIHEIPDQEAFLEEVKSILKTGGLLYIIEPGFIVSKKEFEKTVAIVQKLNFTPIDKPRIFISRSAVFKKIN